MGFFGQVVDSVRPLSNKHDLDFQAALKHLHQLSCSDRQGKAWPLDAGPASLGTYGVGIELYFQFTRRFLVVLGVAAALTLPALVLNCAGQTLLSHVSTRGSGSVVAWLARTTIANLGTLKEDERVVEFLGGRADIRDVTLASAMLDAAATALLLVAAVWFELVSIPKVIDKHRRLHVTPEAFSVSVRRLPEMLPEGNSAYEERLRAHFEGLLRASVTTQTVVLGTTVVHARDKGYDTDLRTRWRWRASPGLDSQGRRLGKVLQVADGLLEVEWQNVPLQNSKSLATWHQDSELLDAALLARLERDDCAPARHKEGEPLVHQVSLVHSYDAPTKFGQRGSPISSPKARPLRLLEPKVCGAFVVFNRSRHRDFLHMEYRFSRIFLGRWFQSPRLDFAGRKIFVGEAPSPSNIFWENLGFPPCRKYFYRALASLACLVVLIGCIGLFSAAKQAGLAAKEYYGTTACEAESGNSTACLCESAGYSGVIKDEPAGIRGQCLSWLDGKIRAGAWGTLAALCVVFINRLLEVVIVKLVDLQRPKTVTSRSRKVMYMVFLVQLVNLGFITALVHFDFGVNVAGEGILNLIGNGNFQDLTFEWYVVVGGSVLLTMGLNTATPLFDVFKAFYRSWWRQRCAYRARSQADLLRLFTPAHFGFAVRHAQQLSALFASLLFSAGMPLLGVMAFLFLCLFYCCDKYVLLRASRVPPRYTEYLMVHLVQLLPFALWLHSFVAVWVYGRADVVPSYCYNCFEYAVVRDFVTTVKSVGDELGSVSALVNRFLIASALPHIVVLLITSLMLLLRLLYFLLGRRFQNSLASLLLLLCPNRKRSTRDSIFDEAFCEGPLHEMKRLKVAYSYNLADVSCEELLNLSLTSSLPHSPTLLSSRPAVKGATAAVATPTSFSGAQPSWTAREASAYIIALRVLNYPEDEPVQRFLEDVLVVAPLPASWAMARDRRDRLYFVNDASQAYSWQHPLEHVVVELAELCRFCLHCSEADRISWIGSLREEWVKNAQIELTKWRTVPQDAGWPYYYNLETRETTWTNPADLLLPELQIRLSAMSWLLDRDYFDRVARRGAPSLSEPSSPAPCTPAPPSAPMSEANHGFLGPHCPNSVCD